MKIGSQRGFSLVEMMIALALTVMVAGGLTISVTSFVKAYATVAALSEAEQNVWGASEMMFRDIRTAGYGVHESGAPLTDWVNWVPGVTNRVVVQEGTTAADPDRLITVGARPVPGGELSIPVAAGATILTLESGGGLNFSLTNNKLLVLDRLETARVTAMSGDTLTISTDPTTDGMGLQFDHPVNSPVELLVVTTYECITTNLSATGGRPYLARFENTATAPGVLSSIAALGVDDLQITELTNNTYAISLVGRSRVSDAAYVHPIRGDHFRRYAVNGEVGSRN